MIVLGSLHAKMGQLACLILQFLAGCCNTYNSTQLFVTEQWNYENIPCSQRSAFTRIYSVYYNVSISVRQEMQGWTLIADKIDYQLYGAYNCPS